LKARFLGLVLIAEIVRKLKPHHQILPFLSVGRLDPKISH